MSNAFDKASLVMLPHAYEEGKLYSLKPTDRSGDFTFSRGTDTATRVGPTGLIEKGRKNLLLQSNQFDSVSWSGLSKTSGILGYDGTNDAWEITKPAQPYTAISQSVSATGVWTFSLYAKANTLDKISIRNQTDGEKADIDLLNGLITYTSSGIVHSDIELISNDWYRLQITFSGSTAQIAIYVAWNNPTAGSVYIQDAQLNQGLVAYPYLETTTAPVYGGLTDDMPRLDYSGGATCPSLLLEPSRTNLIGYSEYFEGWHTDANVSYTANSAISPEGLINAAKLTATNTSNVYVRDNITGSAGNNVFSVFAKYEDCQYIYLSTRFFNGGDEARVWFDIQNGVKGSSTGDDVTYDIEDYGNGWYRCYVIFNIDAGDTNGYTYIYLSNTDGSSNVTSGTSAHLYGGQLEAGSYPTSYIPTYGSSQTRAVDNVNRLDISSLAATYQTLFIEASVFSVNAYQYKFSLNDATGSRTNRLTIFINNDDLSLLVNAQGSSQPSITQNDYISANTTYKIAAVVRDGSYALFANGTKIGEQVGTTPSNLNSLTFGDSGNPLNQNWEGNVNQALVFPTALSDSECIALTTV